MLLIPWPSRSPKRGILSNFREWIAGRETDDAPKLRVLGLGVGTQLHACYSPAEKMVGLAPRAGRPEHVFGRSRAGVGAILVDDEQEEVWLLTEGVRAVLGERVHVE